MKCPLNQTHVHNCSMYIFWLFILNLINTLSIVESNISIINERKQIYKLKTIYLKNPEYYIVYVKG